MATTKPVCQPLGSRRSRTERPFVATAPLVTKISVSKDLTDRSCEDVMAGKVTEEMGECGDPVLSRIGNFGKYQARVSG